jgi:hypothetical protein
MGLIVAWLAVVLIVTLAPFDFGGSPQAALQYGAYQRQGEDFVLNVLLFVPFGARLDRDGHSPIAQPGIQECLGDCGSVSLLHCHRVEPGVPSWTLLLAHRRPGEHGGAVYRSGRGANVSIRYLDVTGHHPRARLERPT